MTGGTEPKRGGPTRARREALAAAAGSAGLLLATPAVGGGRFAWAEPAPPDAPWSAPASAHPDPRVRALSYAILAPNNFNLQPWVAELAGDDRLVLRAALDRRSPECDGGDRQTVVSFGAFLEVLRMAAAGDGFALAVEAFPEGEPGPRLDARPVAAVAFRRDAAAEPDPLFAQVPARRSNKRPFDTGRGVSASTAAALLGAAADPAIVGAVVEPGRVARVRDAARRAAVLEMGLARMAAETAGFTRLGKAAVAAAPYGVAQATPEAEAAVQAGTLTRAALADPASGPAVRAREAYARLVDTAAAHAFVTTPGDVRRDQLAAGREWARLNLKAAELGLAFHPHSHSLHDYPEMRGLFAEMHVLLLGAEGAAAGRRVQMLSRLGYGEDVPPTPRQGVDAVARRA